MESKASKWILRVYYADGVRCMPFPFESEQRLKEQVAELIVKGKKFQVEALSH